MLAVLMALAMMLTTAPAFAAGHYGGGGGGGGHGGGGSGGSGSPTSMYPVNAPSGATATIGFTTSRGYGSATMRITANLPIPSTCAVPYAVALSGYTYTDETQGTEINAYFASLPTPIAYPKVMLPAGSAGAPYCDAAGWHYPGGALIPSGTLTEWSYNQDFAKGFIGSASVINTTLTENDVLFKYPGPNQKLIMLNVRSNPHRGTEGGGGDH